MGCYHSMETLELSSANGKGQKGRARLEQNTFFYTFRPLPKCLSALNPWTCFQSTLVARAGVLCKPPRPKLSENLSPFLVVLPWPIVPAKSIVTCLSNKFACHFCSSFSIGSALADGGGRLPFHIRPVLRWICFSFCPMPIFAMKKKVLPSR